jgi:protoheme ferro-lyase
VLVTYGEPPDAAFVDQLVYSWRILIGLTRSVAPIPMPLIPMIALSRARGRTRMWNGYRYGSPLEPITERQAHRLGEALANVNGASWRVHVAYEFRRPLVADVLRAIPHDEPAVVVPMYAADSAFTHELSRGIANALVSKEPKRDIRVAGALDVEALADLSAGHVLAHTADAGWRGDQVALVLAAHGTVLNPTTPIDTGLTATQQLCDAIAVRLSSHFGFVVNGWLNHTRGGKWTEPAIDKALEQASAAGATRVVYYPYGFLADNAESELEGRMALEGLPAGVESRHLPCMNESPALAALISRLVMATGGTEELGQRGTQGTEGTSDFATRNGDNGGALASV